MRLDWAVACRYAEAQAGTATIVGAGIDTFWVAELPAPIQFFIAMKIAAPEAEFGPELGHELKIELLGPDMTSIGEELRVSFSGGEPGPEHEPGWELTTIIPVLIQFGAETSGTYSLEIYLDGIHKKTVSALVRLGLPS